MRIKTDRKQEIIVDRIRKIADKSLQVRYFVRNCKMSEQTISDIQVSGHMR